MSNDSPKIITIGRPPKCIYCRVVGWLERAWIDLAIVGSDGRYDGDLPRASSRPTIRIEADLIPLDKRFPNTLVWLERLDEPPWCRYVEPESPDSHVGKPLPVPAR